jgi:hypothetical protein
MVYRVEFILDVLDSYLLFTSQSFNFKVSVYRNDVTVKVLSANSSFELDRVSLPSELLISFSFHLQLLFVLLYSYLMLFIIPFVK